jgi:hypothetical protein
VSNDERHMALPKLYGQPAYARPTVMPVAPVERPFDPDDMPLEIAQTNEERELVAELAARDYDGGVSSEPVESAHAREGSLMLRGRPFRLTAITSRFRGNDESSTDA